MVKTIIKIRLFQLLRLLKGIGPFRIIILLLVLWLVSFLTFRFLKNPEYTVKALIIIGLLFFSLHVSRKDKHFIKITMKSPYSIYLVEYLLLSLPFLVIWAVFLNWIGMGMLLLIVLSIPLISVNLKLQFVGSIIKVLINPFNPNINSGLRIRLPFFSHGSFEWISGIRKNFILLMPVYLLMLASSFKEYVAAGSMIFLSILVSGFYYYGEPREFIELYAKSPKEFISRKILSNFKQLIILFSPMLIIALIFQMHTWYFLIGAIIISFAIQVLTIVFKYGLFEENAKLNRNSMLLSLNFLFLLMPMFIPVPIIMSIRYYRKACKNLKKYFHD